MFVMVHLHLANSVMFVQARLHLANTKAIFSVIADTQCKGLFTRSDSVPVKV